MRTSTLALAALLTSIPSALRAQPADAGLPGAPVLPPRAAVARSEPAPKHLGAFALRGYVFGDQRLYWQGTARLEVRQGADGVLGKFW